MRIWVTRTQPGADATARRLHALGHEPAVAPVLEYRALAGARLDLSEASALAFTSANAVEAYARLTGRRDLPVFAVGEATAEAARRIGFSTTHMADGAVTELATLIVKDAGCGLIVWPGPTEPAGDLPALVAAGGGRAVLQPVYETAETGAAPPPGIQAVLIHSPKAARAVAKVISPDQASGLSVYAISEAAAAPLMHLAFADVSAAPRPNETALLDLITG